MSYGGRRARDRLDAADRGRNTEGGRGFKDEDDGRWLPLRLGGVARRGTRKGCVSKQPSPRAHHDPTQHSRSRPGTGTGTGLFSSLVFRDGSASTEARAWRGWQPMDGPVHGETVQISSSLHAKWA
jgi:hypothetical protein